MFHKRLWFLIYIKKQTPNKMKYLKSFGQLNEAKAAKTTDYAKKFAKKIEEVSALIDKAKADDVTAIETDTTVESEYEFKSIAINGSKLTLTYKEVWGKKGDQKDVINLKKDEENNFDEAKYMFSWIKKCIKKGYRYASKESEKEDKE
jgi:hypothetical protein